jgi:leucyl aminopeptidase
MIELSTLTGACVVALGEKTAGVFTNDEDLGKAIIESGKKVDEDFWQLPITEEAKEQMKSACCDLSSSPGARYGGASQAAAFLENFVEKGTKWAHLDIAGPAMAKAPKPPVNAKGTGFGVQTLMHHLRSDFK